MKKKSTPMFALLAVIIALSVWPKVLSAQFSCPYKIKNSTSTCTLQVAWEVDGVTCQDIGSNCTGTVSINPGTTFVLPNTCCPPAGADVYVIVLNWWDGSGWSPVNQTQGVNGNLPCPNPTDPTPYSSGTPSSSSACQALIQAQWYTTYTDIY